MSDMGTTKTDFFLKIEKLQDKALRIINFLPNRTLNNDTYQNSKILKLQDYLFLQNALLVRNCFDEQLPDSLINYFNKTNTEHEHSTHSASQNCVLVPNICTDTYGKNSVKHQSNKT